jgi:hypothetical protein
MKKLLIIFFTFLNLVVFSQTATEFGKTYSDEPWKTYDKKKHWWYFNRDRLGNNHYYFHCGSNPKYKYLT